MIYIKRTPKPVYYASAKMVKEERDLKVLYNSKGQQRMNFNMEAISPIKAHVQKLFNNKCAYCESAVDVPIQGNIENFRPRSGTRTTTGFLPDHYWWLAYQWENLYLTCNVCNKHKRDYFPLIDESTRAAIGAKRRDVLAERILILDPCIDNPKEHLYFKRDGSVAGKTDRGSATIEFFALNRGDLIEARKKSIEEFIFFLEEKQPNKNSLRKDVADYIDELQSPRSKKEYAAALRNVYEDWISSKTSSSSLSNQEEYESSIFSTPKGKKSSLDNRDANIFSIKSIEISNFKNIANLSFEILPTQESFNRETWLLLLGDNGIGKSSILQAIAMTLCGSSELNTLPLKAQDVLRHGTNKGYVKIWSYEHDNSYELHFNAHNFTYQKKKPPTFVLAYGATRLLPKGNLRPRVSRNRMLNIKNLFDYSAALADVNEWIGSVDEKELDGRIFPAILDLLDLGKEYTISRYRKKLYIFDGERKHSLDSISDGFKNVIALACDIMKTLSKNLGGFHSTQGIVLIDELGNHLHPRWRMKIVAALRRTFPQLQFIVSTHEPLCLRGLLHGEVSVLVRDKQKGVRVLNKEMLPDHNSLKIDQLLTSDLFGLINTLDEETEKQYEDYYRLLGKKDKDKTKEDLADISKLSTELAKKEVIGNTPQEQIVYQIVDEIYAKKLLEEGFKTTMELKYETIAEVKKFLIDNGHILK